MSNQVNRLLGLEPRLMKAPMTYPGSKLASLPNVLEILPYRDVYVEPFGGSGVVLLNRKRSVLEVFNDRYAGVTQFYIALKERPDELYDYIYYTVHSREYWQHCLETWETEDDLVARAGKWYYLCQGSFLVKGQSWARVLKSGGNPANKIWGKLPGFPRVHERLRGVQIENQDFRKCFTDYESPEAVIYCDPPYYQVDDSSYACKMTRQDHEELIDLALSSPAFVCISGYPNQLYDSEDWPQRITWDRKDKASSHRDANERVNKPVREEVLWVNTNETS